MAKQPAPEQLENYDNALTPLPKLENYTPRGTVDINPIKHLVAGTKNLYKTNAVAAVCMTILFFAAYYAVALPFSSAANGLYTAPLGHRSGALPATGSLFTGLLFFYLAAFLLSVTVSQAITRLVITGARQQREGFLPALTFALRHMGIAMVTYLAVFGIMILIWLATIVLAIIPGMISPLLAVVAVCIGFGAIIVAALRLMYVSPILADDVKDLHVGEVLRTSDRLWKVSSWAVLCYVGPLIALGIILMLIAFSWAISHGLFYPSSATYHQLALQSGASQVLSAGTIINMLVQSGIILVIGAGIADIYNQAKEYL